MLSQCKSNACYFDVGPMLFQHIVNVGLLSNFADNIKNVLERLLGKFEMSTNGDIFNKSNIYKIS